MGSVLKKGVPVQKLSSLTLYIGCVAGVVIIAPFSWPAHADMITNFLSNGDATISGFPGPYASVTLDLKTSTTVNVRFQALENYTIEAAVLNINATSFTVSLPVVSNSYPNFTPVLCCAAIGSGGVGDPVDNLGRFDLILANFGDLVAFKNSSTTIEFTVTDHSGTWSSAMDVLSDNDLGLNAATFVYVCSTNPCTLAGGATNAGYAVGPGPVPVVVPAPSIGHSSLSVLFAIGVLLFWGGRPLERSTKRRSHSTCTPARCRGECPPSGRRSSVQLFRLASPAAAS